MLEHSSVWVSAPTAAWPAEVPRTGRFFRWVLAADTREPLGHLAIAPARWWPWPAGRRIAAYEAPDWSLLFTARPSGWFRHQVAVADADGHVVATVRGQYVIGRGNRFVAYQERPGYFVGPAGMA